MIHSERLVYSGHIARMEEGAQKNLTGKATGKRPIGRLKCSWEDNIKIDLKEIRVNMRNWLDYFGSE